ncbi:hypothetical protein CVD25_01130 [Bacillus canaveralius]|uniref:Uncharacterized protein n=1 Tax=Bacillus canaveralius TaxID=1403243 RepID=A0A2N5GPM9_9BACI|nr:hypothetical protein CU635_06240 [Bacillus canaveralius]PLS00819.1 hypothetical protein CVD25_01130 [Bacillus canaveralius]
MKLAKNNGSFDDGFRWYHLIFMYMILLPLFLIAILPLSVFSGLAFLTCLASIGIGVFLVWKVPPKYKNKSRED